MALRVWEASIPLLTTLLASVPFTGLVLTLKSRHTFFSSHWLQVWFAFLELLRGNWVLFSLFIIGPFWLTFVLFIWEWNIRKSPSRQVVSHCQLYLCLQSSFVSLPTFSYTWWLSLCSNVWDLKTSELVPFERTPSRYNSMKLLGSHSAHQVWQQGPSSTEPSCWASNNFMCGGHGPRSEAFLLIAFIVISSVSVI